MIGNKNKLDQPSLKLNRKKGILSISIHNQHTFYTSSLDHTIRLWDIRMQSSVKLMKSQHFLQHGITNCQNDGEARVFTASGKNVYAFDIRKQSIFHQEMARQSGQEHFDDIEQIRYSNIKNLLAACDDEGDIRVYTHDLETTEDQFLDQKHTNICNSIDFYYSEKIEGNLGCISGGFDCKMILWNVQKAEVIKEVDLKEVFAKNEVNTTNSMPFIHHVHSFKTSIFVSTQTGHLLCFSISQPKKAKFILEASLTRLVQSRVAKFNENLILTLANDGSFSIFNHTKRQKGVPQFIEKYKCDENGTWIECIENNILVGSQSNNELSIFAIQ